MTFSKYETKQQLVTLDLQDNSNQAMIIFYPVKKDLTNYESYSFDLNSLPKAAFNKLISYTSLAAVLKFAKKYHSYYTSQAPKEKTPCPVPAPAPAKSAAKGQGILFVDLEINTLGKDCQIIELSIVSEDEKVLFHSFLKPKKPIKANFLDPDAIHQLDLVDAPTFDQIWAKFSKIIGRSTIAFYKADYCQRMILTSLAKAFDSDIPKNFAALFPYNKVISVSERYTHFNNYSLGYFQNYGLQSINQACGQQGIEWRDLPNHRATGSAIKSLRLHNYLNNKESAA